MGGLTGPACASSHHLISSLTPAFVSLIVVPVGAAVELGDHSGGAVEECKG